MHGLILPIPGLFKIKMYITFLAGRNKVKLKKSKKAKKIHWTQICNQYKIQDSQIQNS